MPLFLGVEIGGTKLQVALGAGDGSPLVALVRRKVEPQRGAAGVLADLRTAAAELCKQAGGSIAAVAIGFGGPVDAERGVVTRSHQVEGWVDFPLAAWAEKELRLTAVVQNDADTAALAEARFGAGCGYDPLLYVTVGSGIGGGLIVGGRIYRGCGSGAAEIGHLKPGNIPRHVPYAGPTVESIASGWAIGERARRFIADWHATLEYVGNRVRRPDEPAGSDPRDAALAQQRGELAERVRRLVELAGGKPERITAQTVAAAAREGNLLASNLLADATWALGWALAQAVALVNPARIVIGGGVALMGEELFFEPLRREVRRQVFAPFAGNAEIVPAALGEEVVLHGALALARGAGKHRWRKRRD